jgi:hypothetical protein
LATLFLPIALGVCLGRRFPTSQILTFEELLEDKGIAYPDWSTDATFKKAERRAKKKAEQNTLM